MNDKLLQSDPADATPAAGRPVALLVLLTCAVLALGVGSYAVARQLLPARAAAAAPTAASPQPSPLADPPLGRPVRGEITAIRGGTWTVQPAKGNPVTVVVSDQTKFGTRKAPVPVSQFTVGTRVAVAGPRVGDRVQANRITIPPTAATPTG
jgi:hypothetical protein